MKYSLKNKQFSRKKHNIFDKKELRQRSRSTSLTPKKSIQSSNDNIEKPYKINVKPPSLDHSAIDKLNEFDSRVNSLHVQNNQQEHSMFQSFAKNEDQIINSKRSFVATNTNYIKPAQPVRFILPPKVDSEVVKRMMTKNSDIESQSFQICEGDNPSRINRFFAESILAKESQSPQNKVVFEPVVRKSKSKSVQPSLSPDVKSRQQFNQVTPINLKIEPVSRIVYHQHQQSQNLPIEKKVRIIQIPRQAAKIESRKIQYPNHPFTTTHFVQSPPNSIFIQNDIQAQQMTTLRRKIQEQNLQIQYLKNQKQILESNIELQFSPKKGSFHNKMEDHETRRIVTPEKYGVQTSFANNQQQAIDRSKFIELGQILMNNQAKLTLLQRKTHNFYNQLLNKFNTSLLHCQDYLIRIFSQKYFSFSQELNAKLFLVDQKAAQVKNLDHKIDIFTNTFRSIEESLRFTKLKQENIQLSIQNKYKKSDRFWNKDELSKANLMQNQSDISSIRIFNDNDLQEKDLQYLRRLQRNLKQKKPDYQYNENCQQQGFQQFDSFLDDKYSHLVYKRQVQRSNEQVRGESSHEKKRSHHYRKTQKSHPKKKFPVSQIYEDSDKKNHNKSTSQEIEQFSPFQANEMFRNSNKEKLHSKSTTINDNFLKYSEAVPSQDVNPKNYNKNFNPPLSDRNRVNSSFEIGSSKDYDFSQNSFEVEIQFKQHTPRNKLPDKEVSFNSQNMFKKQQPKTLLQNEDISDTLQGEQQRLINILKSKNYQFPVDCWIDQLGCLRKKNQTYIFDEQGSVIMTTSAAFKKLKEKRFFV